MLSKSYAYPLPALSLNFRFTRTAVLLLSVTFLSCSGHGFKPEDLERLQATGTCQAGDLSEADLHGTSLRGKILKGTTLRNADLTEVDFGDVDFYNACLNGAQLSDEGAFREAFPLAGIPGRITTLSTDGEELDLTTIPFGEVATYQERAEAGDPRASFIAAYLYETYGTREQESLAFEYYTRAAEHLAEAQNNQGWMYENGRGAAVPPLERIFALYTQAAAHPRAKYNRIRFEAFYNPNPETKRQAFFELSRLYKEGRGIERDKKAEFWCVYRSADLGHPEAQFKVADFFRNGRKAVPKDPVKAAQWCERAAEGGVLEAEFNAGILHETAAGVPQNYERAAFWYGRAAARKHPGALRNLASLHELGHGVQQNYQTACTLYTEAAQHGKRSAEYSAARMYEYLPRSPENSAAALRLLFSAIEADPPYPGALFLLGTRYEKGRGVATDPSKARALYAQAAAKGYLAAQLKLRLLDQPAVDVDQLFEHMRTLKEEMQERHLRSYQKVQEELAQGHVITLYEGDPYVLKDDYDNAQRALSATVSTLPRNRLTVNYAAISADPYLMDYRDVNQDVQDEEISAEALETFQNTLTEAFQTHPAYVPEISEEFPQQVMAKIDPIANPTLAKRVIRLYKYWTEIDPLPVPAGTEDHLKYRQGDILLRLVQNSLRCSDGLTEYVEGQEWQNIYGHAGEEEPFGYKISKVLTAYKMHFLEHHQTPLAGAHEEATEGLMLLRQRMRPILGIPGSFQEPRYPDLGRGNDEKYRPDKVIERFVRGGTLVFTRGINQRHEERIEAYTPEFMANLLLRAQQDQTILTNIILNAFIEREPILQAAFEKAFIDMEVNEYFDPFVEGGVNIYRPPLFEYLLTFHGYLIG